MQCVWEREKEEGREGSRDRKQEQERETFPLLVHSPVSCNTWLKSGAQNPKRVTHIAWQGPKYLGYFLLSSFWGALVGSWIENKAVRTKTAIPLWDTVITSSGLTCWGTILTSNYFYFLFTKNSMKIWLGSFKKKFFHKLIPNGSIIFQERCFLTDGLISPLII